MDTCPMSDVYNHRQLHNKEKSNIYKTHIIYTIRTFERTSSVARIKNIRITIILYLYSNIAAAYSISYKFIVISLVQD